MVRFIKIHGLWILLLFGVVILVCFMELSVPPSNVEENEVLISETDGRGLFKDDVTHLDTGHHRHCQANISWEGGVENANACFDSDLRPATAPGQPTPTPAPNVPFTPAQRAEIIRSLRALDRYSTWFSFSSPPIRLEYRLNGTLHRFDFQKPPPPEFSDVINALYSNNMTEPRP